MIVHWPRGVADPDRLGVGGWSYGGILTNYVITQTDRFDAAISITLESTIADVISPRTTNMTIIPGDDWAKGLADSRSSPSAAPLPVCSTTMVSGG